MLESVPLWDFWPGSFWYASLALVLHACVPQGVKFLIVANSTDTSSSLNIYLFEGMNHSIPNVFEIKIFIFLIFLFKKMQLCI